MEQCSDYYYNPWSLLICQLCKWQTLGHGTDAAHKDSALVMLQREQSWRKVGERRNNSSNFRAGLESALDNFWKKQVNTIPIRLNIWRIPNRNFWPNETPYCIRRREIRRRIKFWTGQGPFSAFHFTEISSSGRIPDICIPYLYTPSCYVGYWILPPRKLRIRLN
jgi:hypothetical protein